MPCMRFEKLSPNFKQIIKDIETAIKEAKVNIIKWDKVNSEIK